MARTVEPVNYESKAEFPPPGNFVSFAYVTRKTGVTALWWRKPAGHIHCGRRFGQRPRHHCLMQCLCRLGPLPSVRWRNECQSSGLVMISVDDIHDDGLVLLAVISRRL